jgi:hypothetical protein
LPLAANASYSRAFAMFVKPSSKLPWNTVA